MIATALLLIACKSLTPDPADQGASQWNLEATLEARAAATKTVEQMVHATVEAKIRFMEQNGQHTEQPGTDSCDDILKSRLLFQSDASDAESMQTAVRAIQNEQQACAPDFWNPVVKDPTPGDPETCLSWFDGLNPRSLPAGLLTEDGNQPTPTSGTDTNNNIMVHWSGKQNEKPAQGGRCWIYLSASNEWMTDKDLGTVDSTITRIPLTKGDCIVFDTTDSEYDATPPKVSCDQEWSHRMLGSFEVIYHGAHPGHNYIAKQALQQCDPNYTLLLRPNEQGWQLGDRQVQCLQESYGLSLSNPDKLDRLVGTTLIQNGQCFSDAPETSGGQMEVVECSDHWEMRILNTIQIPDSEEYPGRQEITRQTAADCDRRYTSNTYPTPDTWAQGSRTIKCIQNNVTGDKGISTILNRLVQVDRVNQGECFNLYDTPEIILAELTDCSGTWEFQVSRKFTIPREGEYPGEDYIDGSASVMCGEQTVSYLYPDQLQWELGDRSVTCLTTQEEPTSRTLQESNPSEIALNGNVPPITPKSTPHPTRKPAPEPTPAPTPPPQPEPTTIPTISDFMNNRPTSPHLTDTRNDRWLAQSRPQIAAKLSNLPWVSDGLSPHEAEIIEQLTYLYVATNTPEAASIPDMPFLQSIEPGDLQAVRSLKEISQKSPSTLQQIVNHPTFANGGITNDWTPVVAVLLAASKHNHSLIASLLDPAIVHMETRAIQTALAGPIELNIVRTGPEHVKESMDRLEYAVHNVESFMGTPFPTDTVTVLYAGLYAKVRRNIKTG